MNVSDVEESLRVDMARVRAFVAAAPAVPTTGFVLPTDGSDTHRVLRALLARRTLRRLLMAIAQGHASSRQTSARRSYAQCVEALLACPDGALERLCSGPELVGIAADPPAHDELAAELSRILLPELAALGSDCAPFGLLPDLGGGFTLRRAGVRIVAEQALGELQVRIAGGSWQVMAGGRFHAPHAAPGLRIEPLPHLLGQGPLLSPAPTAWVAERVRDQELAAVGPADFALFCDAMRSGAETLAAAWPAAWREVADGLRWLLPLPDRGLAPHNYSVHALRGLVVTSPRRGHRCAQTLVHEAGHNRLSTILDLFELCTDPGRIVESPVVNAPRPMSFVFHGCFAFAQDVALTARLLPLAPAAERASMARYLDEVRNKARAAMDLLRREAHTTSVGAAVLDEISQVLDR